MSEAFVDLMTKPVTLSLHPTQKNVTLRIKLNAVSPSGESLSEDQPLQGARALPAPNAGVKHQQPAHHPAASVTTAPSTCCVRFDTTKAHLHGDSG